MIERPILFSGPMVRALLDGRKTQTRRVIKPQPVSEGYRPLVSWNRGVIEYSFGPLDRRADGLRWWRCPYGQPGDRLWVREQWGLNHYAYCRPNPIPKARPADLEDYQLVYFATEDDCEVNAEMPRTPSIHMPRWASRLTLEITDVRVERLNDCSQKDACAEGWPNDENDPREWYAALWEAINGGGSWDANPWVWAVTFAVVEPVQP